MAWNWTHRGTYWGYRTKLGIVWLIPLKNKKKLFYYEGGQTLTQVAQRGFEVSVPGGIQIQLVMSLRNFYFTSLKQGSWNGYIQRFFQSLQFCDSVKHRSHGREQKLLKWGHQEHGSHWRISLKGVRDMASSWGNVGGCCQGVDRVLWGCRLSGRMIRVPWGLQ